MCSYKNNQVFLYDPTELAIHSILRPEDDIKSNCGQKFKKNFFDDIVHFIDEANIVTFLDFDCGITFYSLTPTNFRQVNREQNYISRSRRKTQMHSQ